MSDTTTREDAGAPRGAASFCIPRAVIEALLDAHADALMVTAYLTLARHTDATGTYSSASVNAISAATGTFKPRVEAALARLKAVHVVKRTRVSNGRTGKAHAWIQQTEDLGPILFDREAWVTQTGEVLPDGPHARAQVRHILPAFDEDPADRVWFGANLVAGFGDFRQPLKTLKNAGDAAARLLLSLYAAHDLEGWGGVRPVGPEHGPWCRYEAVQAKDDDDGNYYPENHALRGGGRLVRWTQAGQATVMDERISGGDNDVYWDALKALESAGLVYEAVLVLNRDPVNTVFSSGAHGSTIDTHAEPLYELDTRGTHGFKPAGEEGLAAVTADTAGKLGWPVTGTGTGAFWAYAAIVQRGFGCHVIGLYRLRFRVANPKNSGVRGAWARIHQGNRDALTFINGIRKARGLDEVPAPWDQAKAAKRRKETQAAEPPTHHEQPVGDDPPCPF